MPMQIAALPDLFSMSISMKNIFLALTVISLTAWPAIVSSQEPLEAGARVRVAIPQRNPMIATFSAWSADTIQLTMVGGAQVKLAMANIIGLEKSVGRETHFWKHFAIGVSATGLAVGLVSAATWTPCRQTGPFACLFTTGSRGEAFALGGVAGVVIGVPIGALAGALIKRERWQQVTLP
jgi:hypothetical protein